MLCDMYKPYVSGVTNHVSLLKRALEGLGHEVWVLTFGSRDHEDDEPRVVRSPGAPFGDTGWQFGFGLSREAKRAVASLDVAHAHHPFLSGRLALRACVPAGIPVVMTNHTRYDLYSDVYAHFVPKVLRYAYLRRTLRSLYRRASLVVSPSADIAGWILGFGIDAHVEVVHNGIDTRRFCEPASPWTKKGLGLAEDAVACCFLGRLGQEKSVRSLYEAWSAAARRDPRLALVFIGDGPERAALERAASDDGWRGRVIFTGLVDYDRVPGLLAGCDAFATASVSEVHPLTVMEAMAAGMPVVAVRSPGVGETVEDGVTGLLVEDSGSALTDALGRIADDEERGLLARGAGRAAEGFDVRERARELVSLYEALL